MSEPRKAILEQLAAGTIDAAEAAVQLAALKASAGAASKGQSPAAPKVAKKKMSVSAEKPTVMDTDPVKPAATRPPQAKKAPKRPQNARAQTLRIRAASGGASIFSLNVPLSLLQFGQQMGGRFGPDISGAELDTLNVSLGNDDDYIRIYVE